MPLNPTPTEDPSTDVIQPERVEPNAAPADPDRPISFVPHVALESTARIQPLRVRTGRHGELEEHELVRLLDTLEDERARARFRESVYISVFIWMAIALVTLFGPRYLWHAPRLVLPSEVLRQRDLAILTAPSLNPPRPVTPQSVDRRTLEHLRSTEPKSPVAPTPTQAPRPSQPEPTTQRTAVPPPPTPTPHLEPTPAPPNLPSAPAPAVVRSRTPPPVVAEAPRPQPSSRPDFGGVPKSASEAMQQAVQGAGRGSGGTSAGVPSHNRGGAAVGMGPAEILSDTQGVNFNPYLRRILQEIYDEWIPLIPEEARPPLRKSGVTMVRFTILPDGTIGAMHLDGSTHDDALNKAAWGSITGVGQFPALPSQFHGPNLELRIHYLVNQDSE